METHGKECDRLMVKDSLLVAFYFYLSLRFEHLVHAVCELLPAISTGGEVQLGHLF